MGLKYLLDTNICIYLINRRSPKIVDHVRRIGLDVLAVSAVTVAEMEYGIQKSQSPEASRVTLVEFLLGLEILDFTTADSYCYGRIRAYLERAGKPIGPYDMQIAAQAISRELTLVTNNEREFVRVPGLAIENWAK